MSFKKVFVTVGTTEFDALIHSVCKEDFIRVLKNLNCSEITIQYGKANEEDYDFSLFGKFNINVKKFSRYNNNEHFIAADLIISHAGAGSIIETLKLGKPLLVVVNESLMDNHQIELAERLQNEQNLFYSTPNNLTEVLESKAKEFIKLKPYEQGNGIDKFLDFLHLMINERV